MTQYNKPLILMVESSVKNVQSIGNFLIENNFNINVATNKQQAYNILKNTLPDLILLNIKVNDSCGFEMCNKIKNNKETKNIPIIFISEIHDANEILKGFSMGCADFITKPFHEEELVRRIENQLERKFARDLLHQQTDEMKFNNSKLNQELSIASEYFSSLLPRNINNSKIQTFWKYVPMAQLGGDAFGFFEIDDKHTAIFLFDVCGHGIASGMYSVSLINTLKYQNLPDTDFTCPKSVLTALNKIYQIHEHYGMYFTICYCVYNHNTRILKYANAGHHPAIISFPNGASEFLTAQNYIVGGLKEYDYISDEIAITPKSEIYIFSDGTFNLKKPDGTIWDINDLKEFIETRHSRNDRELLQLYDFVSSLSEFNKQKDDFTILKVRFK